MRKIVTEESFLAIKKSDSDAFLVRLPLIDEESPSPMNFEYMDEFEDTDRILRFPNLAYAVFIKESIEQLHSDGEEIEVVTVSIKKKLELECI